VRGPRQPLVHLSREVHPAQPPDRKGGSELRGAISTLRGRRVEGFSMAHNKIIMSSDQSL
jgi:hypothetical protein